MACNKWEETGLLFSSGELSADEHAEYSAHIAVCSECSEEYTMYTSMQKRFFTAPVLEAQPSAGCDAEIFRVCADGRKKITTLTFSPFAAIFKRTVISLSLFALGFVSVSYVTMKMNNSTMNQTANVAEVNTLQKTDSAGASTDSSSDSIIDNSVNYANKRGNMGLKGVVPVDLQNK